MGAEVTQRGFKSLKTNIFRFDGPRPRRHMPGFMWQTAGPELNIDRDVVQGATK